MRQCALCGKRTFENELIGRLCSRCDHLQSKLTVDTKAESQSNTERGDADEAR